MRLAATGDLHARVGHEERIATLLGDAGAAADALAIAGDVTEHGRVEEAEVIAKALAHVGAPVVAVLGNHDHESGSAAEVTATLRDAGVTVLDRGHAVVGGVGFAGAKGFCGGFDERIVRAFGEDPLKAFVAESVAEATALRAALAALPSGPRVALLHYAPLRATLVGEPEEIWPFLGTSRLAEAVDESGADLVLHGHAHHGSAEGRTPRGVPVANVALPVLARAGAGRFRVFELP